MPARLAMGWALLQACSSLTSLPLRPGADPAFHGMYAIAFAPDGSQFLALDRLGAVGDSPERLALVLADTDKRSFTHFGSLEVTLEPAWDPHGPARRRMARALRSHDVIAHSVATLGFEWAELVGPGPVHTKAGAFLVHGDSVVLEHSGGRVRLAQLGAAPEAGAGASARAWLSSPSGAALAVELDHPGPVSVRALHVFQLKKARAQLLAVRAFAAYEDGHLMEALRLWRQANTLAPNEPDTLYNMACAHARLGHSDEAIGYLRQAFAAGGDRYLAWAQEDPDLAELAAERDLVKLLGRRATAR